MEYVDATSFAEVCARSDENFVKSILVDRRNACFAYCGSNFRFEKVGSGTPGRVGEIGAKYGRRVEGGKDVCIGG